MKAIRPNHRPKGFTRLGCVTPWLTQERDGLINGLMDFNGTFTRSLGFDFSLYLKRVRSMNLYEMILNQNNQALPFCQAIPFRTVMDTKRHVRPWEANKHGSGCRPSCYTFLPYQGGCRWEERDIKWKWQLWRAGTLSPYPSNSQPSSIANCSVLSIVPRRHMWALPMRHARHALRVH